MIDGWRFSDLGYSLSYLRHGSFRSGFARWADRSRRGRWDALARGGPVSSLRRAVRPSLRLDADGGPCRGDGGVVVAMALPDDCKKRQCRLAPPLSSPVVNLFELLYFAACCGGGGGGLGSDVSIRIFHCPFSRTRTSVQMIVTSRGSPFSLIPVILDSPVAIAVSSDRG